jgi:hypothetical protein
VCPHNSIYTRMPEVASQLHHTRNTDIDVASLPASSHQKLWFKHTCQCGQQHEWLASLYSRKSGHGCPICAPAANKLVCRCKSVAGLHPDLAAELDNHLSGDIDLFTVSAGSNDKLWWKCIKKTAHPSWKASPHMRRGPGGSGCPVCNESKLEILAAEALSSLCLTFDRQFKWPEQRKGGYDFRIFDDDCKDAEKQSFWLFELDGRQHFMGICFGSSKKTPEEMFKTNVQRDLFKEQLVRDKQVDLLRIPYTVTTVHEMANWIEHFVSSRAKVKSGAVKQFTMCVTGIMYQKRDSDYDELCRPAQHDL